MKTGNTLPGCECLEAELHDKTNSNPNDQFCSRLGFLSIFITRELENYKIRCLSYKGHCKKRKKNPEQSAYTIKLRRLNTWNMSIIESVNCIELNASSTVSFNTIKCSCFNSILTLLRQQYNHWHAHCPLTTSMKTNKFSLLDISGNEFILLLAWVISLKILYRP